LIFFLLRFSCLFLLLFSLRYIYLLFLQKFLVSQFEIFGISKS
jgi:hypothetical protein